MENLPSVGDRTSSWLATFIEPLPDGNALDDDADESTPRPKQHPRHGRNSSKSSKDNLKQCARLGPRLLLCRVSARRLSTCHKSSSFASWKYFSSSLEWCRCLQCCLINTEYTIIFFSFGAVIHFLNEWTPLYCFVHYWLFICAQPVINFTKCGEITLNKKKNKRGSAQLWSLYLGSIELIHC